MKKYIYLLFIFSLSTANAQDNSKNKKTVIKVSGNCEMCKMRIEKASLSLKGVKYASWSIPDNELRLIYNSNKIDIVGIHTSISNSGHATSERKAHLEIYNALPVYRLYAIVKI